MSGIRCAASAALVATVLPIVAAVVVTRWARSQLAAIESETTELQIRSVEAVMALESLRLEIDALHGAAVSDLDAVLALRASIDTTVARLDGSRNEAGDAPVGAADLITLEEAERRNELLMRCAEASLSDLQ